MRGMIPFTKDASRTIPKEKIVALIYAMPEVQIGFGPCMKAKGRYYAQLGNNG
jgi:hypothetical protein